MKSQSDIAQENQKGIEKANKRQADDPRETESERATRFDGDPNPVSAGGALKPKDDTPFRIKKRRDPDQ